MNGIEYFPLYAAAVLSCLAVDVDREKLKRMCTLAFVLRVVYYTAFSVQKTKASSGLRSLAWVVGLAHTCQFFRVAAEKYDGQSKQ